MSGLQAANSNCKVAASTWICAEMEENMGPKRLVKSRTNRVICGVCGGIGEYLNIDPTIIRLVLVLLGCTTTGIIVYLVAAVIMPEGEW